jgi:hypothetical protein
MGTPNALAAMHDHDRANGVDPFQVEPGEILASQPAPAVPTFTIEPPPWSVNHVEPDPTDIIVTEELPADRPPPRRAELDAGRVPPPATPRLNSVLEWWDQVRPR